MSITTEIQNGLDARVATRLLDEGYGPGAWHGPDMKAALDGVTPELAFWRPAPGRHSIAEIALHHASCVRSVRGRLSGTPLEPFVLEGEDWFELSGPKPLGWDAVRTALESEQRKLAAVVAGLGDGGVDPERFDLILGITCHAVYHAGQVQLLRRLSAG
jgi:hypothetical protein